MKVYISTHDLSLFTVLSLTLLKKQHPNLTIIRVSEDDLISYVDNPNTLVIAINGSYDHEFNNYLGINRVNDLAKDFNIDITLTENITQILTSNLYCFSHINKLDIDEQIIIISLFIKTL